MIARTWMDFCEEVGVEPTLPQLGTIFDLYRPPSAGEGEQTKPPIGFIHPTA